MDLNGLVQQLASLGGVAALITVVVNALKTFGVVKDGDAPTWTTGFNVLALGALFVGHVVGLTNFDKIDAVAATLAQLGTFLLALLLQIGTSKITHLLLRGVPVIGHSFSRSNLRSVQNQFAVGQAPGYPKR